MTDIVERLAGHATLGAAPRHELEWLASHGTLREAAAGEILTTRRAPVTAMFILLSGRVAIYRDRGGGTHKAMEWHAGDVTGLLPYSRLKNPPGETMAEEPSTMLCIGAELLPEMIRECYVVTSILVHRMLDRARAFTTSDLHDDKLRSLGKLSAGLAHELNNPASAIERSAQLLEDRLDEAERATMALGKARLDDAQLAAVAAIRHSCSATRATGVRSPLEQTEHEDSISDWLETHGVDTALAETLAETNVTFDDLDRLAAAVDGPALQHVLRWAAAGCVVRGLAAEIQEAALRIAGLVIAIKGFTHMDQAQVAEPVDVVQGLQNTVAVLRAKARAKSAAVTIDADDALPRVRGFVGELNQIWGNLIDNALDAIPESGRVEVRASREHDSVVVTIVDNGPGIPAEIRDRIFDPFLTTKPMGKGTGLGLDIVQRLVRHNDAAISVRCEPGRTEFRVTLPVATAGEAGA